MLISLDLIHSALLRKRQLRPRLAGTQVGYDRSQDGNQYEVFTVRGPLDHYSGAASFKAAIRLADKTAQQAPGTVVSVWSPVRAHVYQCCVVDNRLQVPHGPARLRTAAFDTPEELVEELVRFIRTTDSLDAMEEAVRHNQTELMTKGVYDSQTATKAWIPVADAAVRQYQEQYGGTGQEQYPQDIRRLTAERLQAQFEQEAREEPQRFVDEYIRSEREAPAAEQQTIELDRDGDGTPTQIVININAHHDGTV